MIATSPMIRTRTSRASRFEIDTGRAVWARNSARSTSDPSGLLHRKSSARISGLSSACEDGLGNESGHDVVRHVDHVADAQIRSHAAEDVRLLAAPSPFL